MDAVSNPGRRPLVLYKRWALRSSVTPADVASFVARHIRPAYRRLSPEVTLRLELSLDGASVVAVQRWTSGDAHEAATSAEAYTSWWAEYEPVLEQWDRLVGFVSEWESMELDLDVE